MKKAIDLDMLFPTTAFDPNMEIKPVDWLIDGLWQRGKINAISGYVKQGKSRLSNWLLAGLLGNDLSSVGLKTFPVGKVLYLAGEEPASTVNARLKWYASVQNIPVEQLRCVDFIEAAGMKLNSEQYQDWLERKLPGYDLVFIDPMRRVHSANENDNSEMAAINNKLRHWTNKMGHTLVFVHHTPKPSRDDMVDMTKIENWLRGAGDIAAIVDTAMFVARSPNKMLTVRRDGRYAPMLPLSLIDYGSDTDMGFGVAH